MKRTFVVTASIVALLTTLMAFPATGCPEDKPVKKPVTRTVYASKEVVKTGGKTYVGRTDSQGTTRYRDSAGTVVTTCKSRGNKNECR